MHIFFNVVATVQERLAADTTLPGPGGTRGSMEGACRNVMLVAGRTTLAREMYTRYHNSCDLSYYSASGSQYICLIAILIFCCFPHTPYNWKHIHVAYRST